MKFEIYLSGEPIRDRAQQRLLERFRRRVHPSLHWSTEAPLPIPGDRRAWDALIRGTEWRVGLDAETVLGDVQATERRLGLKVRDGGVDAVILLVADTRRNRAALAAAPAAFADLSRDARGTFAALGRGSRPPRSAILFL